MTEYEPIEPMPAPRGLRTTPRVLVIGVSTVTDRDGTYVRAQLGDTVAYRRGALARERAITAVLEEGRSTLAAELVSADMLLGCGVEVRVVEARS